MNKESVKNIINNIAVRIHEAGGEAYFVGGYVRDAVMGRDNTDIDIEVHKIDPEELYSILGDFGTPVAFGRSFGIYSIKGTGIDIAMPRIERATGSGHRDFEISVDPMLGTYNAAKRRDFTINSLMQNVLTGEVTDHFGGLDDIERRVIRHVDEDSFVEDSLRVLRAAQFASRFEFEVDDETVELCRSIDLSTLSRERVEEELKKALIKGVKPSIFFETLKEMDQLDYWFPELKELIDLPQDPVFHPEGDVWVHTMEVLDRGAEVRDRTSSPYAFMLLCLTHDLGKIITTDYIKGRYHAYEHETKGIPIIERFLHRITNEKNVIKYVLNMAALHMRPNILAYQKSSLKATNRMFDEAVSPEDLIYFAQADKPVVSGDEPFDGDCNFLRERLEEFERIMVQPYVTGADLIKEGLEPGEYFTDALSYSHKLRLAGVDKQTTLKQTLAYIRKKISTDNRKKKQEGQDDR
ncbi:MAG: CCA tRNA nucleotidyltransferase [Clostridiales bacterium]|nr:CCA tRNA nucleotidyltransferase [Candidatus Crickella merdequi]